MRAVSEEHVVVDVERLDPDIVEDEADAGPGHDDVEPGVAVRPRVARSPGMPYSNVSSELPADASVGPLKSGVRLSVSVIATCAFEWSASPFASPKRRSVRSSLPVE